MTDTKIVKLYNVMDAQEKRGLQIWLENRNLWSQKKGNHDDLLRLHNCIIKYAKRPRKLSEQIENLNKINQLRHQLFNIAENFLLVNWLTKKTHKSNNFDLQKKLLMVAYYQAKELPENSISIIDLSKLIEFKLNDIGNHLEKTNANNIDEYYQIHKFYHHLYYNLNTHIWQKGSEYLKKLLQHLNTFLGLTKMRYYTEALYRKKIRGEQFNLPDIESTQLEMVSLNENLIEQNANNTLFELYLLCFELSIKESKVHLKLLTDKIIEKAPFLNEKELGTILTFAINYASFITRKNHIDLTATHFNLHKLGLERSVFLTNGLLQPQILINYAYICCEEQKPNEIDSAWKKYQFRIEDDYKEPTLNLCLAYKLFAQNKFKESLEYLSKYSKRKIRFYLRRKVLQIKCLYEIRDYSKFEEERVNLVKYLNNNKDEFNDDYLYESLYNFTQIVRDLSNPDQSKEKLLLMLKKNTVERAWLSKKINNTT